MKLRRGYILLIFVTTTIFFIYQHTIHIDWDYQVYVLMAKYFVTGRGYFEVLRPPLISLMLSLFSPLGWKIAEYAYILLVSVLFFICIKKFSKKYKVDTLTIYTLFFTSFTLFYSFLVGGELLSMSFLILALTYLIDKPFLSGSFMALAGLTRYPALIFLPLGILTKSLRKIAFFYLGVFITFVPWLIFNYINWGNPLASIMESFLLNVGNRKNQPITPRHFLIAWNILFFLFPLGVFFKKLSYKDFVIMVFLILALISFYKISYKYVRYLYWSVFPVAYFSSKFVENHIKGKYYILILLIIANIFIAIYFTKPTTFYWHNRALKTVGNCSISSNEWVTFNYLGRNAIIYPHPKQKLYKRIEEGYRIVLFKKNPEPPYVTDRDFMSSLPLIEETEIYYIIGIPEKCKLETNKTFVLLYAPQISKNLKASFNILLKNLISWTGLQFPLK